ncbi:ScyD/ScyE family protein [Terrabacter sp. BE26]|uniref:ScyD/ScyE family protein n=1 Tax=Terrabacter sp. BE26 TaxID=2898152 RepID=UPI0035BE4E36
MIKRKLLRRCAGVGAVALAAGVAGAGSGVAHPSSPTSHVPEVIAWGLHSPRQLAFSPEGGLYVAESGSTGTMGCQPSREDPKVKACAGLTGSVARVGEEGRVERVVTGLPSAGAPGEALGPSDLVFTGDHRFSLVIGLGGPPAYRAAFGPVGARLGTLVSVNLRSRHDDGSARVTRLADLAAFEARENPDGTDIDSDPVGVARSGEGYVYADAGANAVNTTRRGGSTVAVLPPVPTTVSSPPSPVPVGFKADSVPTDVVKGPDGAWYISQLVGFPFEKGSSKVWRVVPGHKPTVYASGLTNVTSLAFDRDGHLYAVEISANGLLKGPIGALVRVPAGSTSPRVVTGGLFAPYGLALRGDHAYVTTGSVAPDGGKVVKIEL